MRTARSRTSDEYFGDVLRFSMAPVSQELEPPANTGRVWMPPVLQVVLSTFGPGFNRSCVRPHSVAVLTPRSGMLFGRPGPHRFRELLRSQKSLLKLNLCLFRPVRSLFGPLGYPISGRFYPMTRSPAACRTCKLLRDINMRPELISPAHWMACCYLTTPSLSGGRLVQD